MRQKYYKYINLILILALFSCRSSSFKNDAYRSVNTNYTLVQAIICIYRAISIVFCDNLVFSVHHWWIISIDKINQYDIQYTIYDNIVVEPNRIKSNDEILIHLCDWKLNFKNFLTEKLQKSLQFISWLLMKF